MHTSSASPSPRSSTWSASMPEPGARGARGLAQWPPRGRPRRYYEITGEGSRGCYRALPRGGRAGPRLGAHMSAAWLVAILAALLVAAAGVLSLAFLGVAAPPGCPMRIARWSGGPPATRGR
jgi:hypothetical protein